MSFWSEQPIALPLITGLRSYSHSLNRHLTNKQPGFDDTPNSRWGQNLSICRYVLDKPEIKGGTSVEITSWINQETEVICKVEGVPVPEITWSRDGTVASSIQFRSRISTLKFTPQEAKDFGDYVCKGKNVLGAAKKTITVKQLGKEFTPLTIYPLTSVFLKY